MATLASLSLGIRALYRGSLIGFLGCGISLLRRPGLGILKQKGGKILEVGRGGGWGLYLDVLCCLQVNGPVTGGIYKWGERGLISGEGDLWPDVSFCRCFTGKWTCNWGNLYVGGGGLITRCIVVFTEKWCFSVGGWRGGGS